MLKLAYTSGCCGLLKTTNRNVPRSNKEQFCRKIHHIIYVPYGGLYASQLVVLPDIKNKKKLGHRNMNFLFVTSAKESASLRMVCTIIHLLIVLRMKGWSASNIRVKSSYNWRAKIYRIAAYNFNTSWIQHDITPSVPPCDELVTTQCRLFMATLIILILTWPGSWR